MNPWRQKPDPTTKATRAPLDIDEIVKRRAADDGKKPPEQNTSAEVPYTRLVHHIDELDNLSLTVPIDRGIVERIQHKAVQLEGNTRQSLSLNLMGHDGELFSVTVWIVPIFSDGILVHHVFAADDENQELLRHHRNPVKPSNYDITSL